MANINQMDPEYHVIIYLRYGCDIKYRDIHRFVLFFQTILLYCSEAAFLTLICVNVSD